MDLDEMLEELNRLQKVMKKLDPSTEAYTIVAKNFHELSKVVHEELESRDSELDHDLKRENDKARLELSKIEERNRKNQGIWDTILGFAKIGGSIAGTLAAILLTGTLEESTILSQKCFSLIKGVLPPKN